MRKFSLFFVSMLLLSIILAACGGEKTGTGSSSNGDNSNTSKTESVSLVAYSAYPENNHNGEGLKEFASKLEEATNGQVKLEVQLGGSLGYEGPELLTVVRDGAVPISDMLTSGVAGDEPLFEIVTLPFLVLNFEEGKILNEIARPYFDKVAEEKWNQKILYVTPWPAAGFWTKDEVTSLADMKGLKMRTYDQNGALVVEAVGGTPLPLPFSEVYTSLQTGVIDSVLTSTPTAVDAKFWEVLDYYVPANVTMATNIVTMNLDEFNKLESATQEKILEVSAEMEKRMWEIGAELDKEMEAIANENGIQTIEPSEEFMNELTEITESIRQEWLKTAPEEAKEILEKFYERVGR